MTPSPSNKTTGLGKKLWGGMGDKILKKQAKDDREDIIDSKKILSEIKKHTFKLMSS